MQHVAMAIFLSCSLRSPFCLFFQHLDRLSEELPEHCANLQQCNWTEGRHGQRSCVQTHIVAPDPVLPASSGQQTPSSGVKQPFGIGHSDLEIRGGMSVQSLAMTESGPGPSSSSSGE